MLKRNCEGEGIADGQLKTLYFYENHFRRFSSFAVRQISTVPKMHRKHFRSCRNVQKLR